MAKAAKKNAPARKVVAKKAVTKKPAKVLETLNVKLLGE